MRRQTFKFWPGVALAAILAAGCGQTDAGITTAVKAQLAADDSVPAQEINVETQEGVVTLTGAVHTDVARLRAGEIARETRGVRDVINELHTTPGVAATTGIGGRAMDEAERGVRTTDPQWREGGAGDADARAGDVAVTTSVRTAFMEDTSLKDLAINVSTRENVVTLTGTVPSQTEKHRAIELARETEGVRSVVDRLRVEPK
jgi:hyperosmotically inducible periplasmic protein